MIRIKGLNLLNFEFLKGGKMASEILYGQSILKPYFNMQKFEDTIYNRPRIRIERIKKRKRIMVLDKLLVVVAILLFAVLLTYISAIVLMQVRIHTKNSDINRLKSSLEIKTNENGEKIDTIKSEIKFDDLKMKAYMEFNMITPTEKNIIYFDKTDNGFVRQYENIR